MKKIMFILTLLCMISTVSATSDSITEISNFHIDSNIIQSEYELFLNDKELVTFELFCNSNYNFTENLLEFDNISLLVDNSILNCTYIVFNNSFYYLCESNISLGTHNVKLELVPSVKSVQDTYEFKLIVSENYEPIYITPDGTSYSSYDILINPSVYDDLNDTIEITISSEDTCTYSGSGDWIINCSDNCNLVETNMNKNNITASGSGTITGFSNISNYTVRMLSGGCHAYQ